MRCMKGQSFRACLCEYCLSDRSLRSSFGATERSDGCTAEPLVSTYDYWQAWMRFYECSSDRTGGSDD